MYKILFHLNCLEQGGAERVVSNLSNQFSKKGYEVVVATEWQGEKEFRLEKEVRRIHVGLQERDEKKSRAVKVFLRHKYLRKAIQEEKPDIVIAFAHKANYRALASTIGMKLPVVIAVRIDPVGNYDGLEDKILIPLLYPRAAGCVFQTQGQKEFFPQYLQQKSRIILNPVHDKYLNVPKPQQREKVVVQSCRLVDFKNQPMLLNAFLKVHEKHPDYQLKLYGGDSFDGTKEILEQIIREHHAEAFIHLMGPCDELEKELPKASVYALSSDYEGLPNALLEAMVLGLPVVATDCPCGGPKTVITHEENGLLVPIKDEDALAAGINRLIEDRDLAERLGQNARKLSEQINNTAIQEQWQEYLTQIIERKGS